jgi:hypothetical protein
MDSYSATEISMTSARPLRGDGEVVVFAGDPVREFGDPGLGFRDGYGLHSGQYGDRLDERAWRVFDEALSRPAAEVPGLRELLSAPTILDPRAGGPPPAQAGL